MKISKSAQGEGVLSERIKADVSQMILNGELVAGDRLKLSELAHRFGVSVMPVREALWRLESSGMIESIPNRGAVVRGIDDALVVSIYETRRSIEAMLLEKAAANATSEDIRQVTVAQRAFEAAAARGDAVEILDSDTRFHLSINTLAGNDFALSVLRESSQLTGLVRLRVGFTPERLSQAIEDHDRIVRALADGDIPALVQSSNLHSNGARRDLLTQLQQSNAREAKGR